MNTGEQSAASLSRWTRIVRVQIDLYRLCAQRLHENNLIALSAALSFRTIFALIPLLILAFLTLKAMGVVDDGRRALRDFLHTTGMTQIVAPRDDGLRRAVDDQEPFGAFDPPAPALASAPTTAPAEPAATQPVLISVADQIEALVGRVEAQLTIRRIGPIGVLLMIWTALGFLMTLEEALNRIFCAPRNRSVARRILLYWTALTLGPLAIVSVNYLGKLVIDAFAHVPGVSGVALLFGWAAPMLAGMFVVAMLYKLMPNTHVPLRSALWGALLTVPVWMVARWGFAIYVERFVLPGNLYGVLGAIPLFLFWLNISWSIFLFGAEIAYAVNNFDRLRAEQNAEQLLLGPSDWLSVAAEIARRFVGGAGPPRLDEIAAAARIPAESARRVLDRLVSSGLFCVAGDDDPATPLDKRGYTLTRPPERIAVSELLTLADARAPDDASALGTLYGQMREALAGATLAQLIPARDGGSRPPPR